jgi:putative DNA primase/helicase
MVLAAIGILQPTIMDRGIEVRMLRKLGTDTVPRLPNNLVSAAKTARAQFLKWAMDNASIIGTSTIEPPNVGSDRAVDNWLPLFTIAKQISPEWYKKCEQAYQLLEANAKEPELPTLLLEDLRLLLVNHGGKSISSAELVSKLVEDKDKPWCEVNNGRSMSAHKLAEMLKPYGIKPKSIRIGINTPRGYDIADFKDTFERYL